MMKNVKRILTSVVSATLLLNTVGISYAQETTNNDYIVLLNEDFEISSSSEYGELSLTAAEKKGVETAGGKAAKINIDGTDKRVMDFTLNEPITQGTVYIGYDYYSETPGYSLDVYTASAEQKSVFGDSMGLRFDSGTLCVLSQLDWDNWSSTLGSSKVELQKWYRVETWLDFDAKVADFYLDGIKIASTEIGEKLPCFLGWGRSNRFSGVKDGVEYIDNLNITHIKNHNASTTLEGAQSVPDHWKTLVKLGVSTEALGGTFFDEEANVQISVQNLQQESVNGNLVVEARDDIGKIVYKESREITVDVSELKNEEFLLNLPKYGYYEVYTYFENPEYNAMGYLNGEAEYTIVRAKESSVQNLKLGYSAHSTWGHGLSEIDRWYEMLSKLGFKLARDPLYWNDFQPTAGSPMVLSNSQKIIAETAKEKNISNYMLLGGGPGLHFKNGLPETKEELDKFYNYVYEMIKQVQAINPQAKYVELYNEYQGYDAKSTVAMQKVGYEAAKAADPNIVVVGGVTARFPLDWMESILKEGFGNYIDAFSGHPYTSEAKPEDISFKYGTAMQQVQSARELLDKYGCQDVDIILSELSYTAYAACETEVDQAAYGIRQYMMTSPLVEEYIWYNAINKKGTGTASEFEANYGLLKSWAMDTGVPYQAKPAALAFGAYNDLLAQGKNLGRVETDDEDVYIYKFKTRNNEDVIAVWNWLDEIETIGLSLESDTAELYDMYGNKTDIVADAKGVFNVAISGEPIYIKGIINNVQMTKSDFKQPYTEFDICMGEKYSIPLNIHSLDGAEITVEADDNINVTKIDFDVLEFTVGFNLTKNSAIKVIVKKEGVTLYDFKIITNYVDPITYSGVIKAYNTERYMYEITITNKRKNDISATLTINEPQRLDGKTFKINNIVGEHSRKLRVNIPIKDADTEKLTLSGTIDVTSSDGEQKIPFEISEYIGCIKYTTKSPTIDGKIDVGEWDTYLPLKMNKKSLTANMEWGGTSDLSAEVYTMIDDNFMYIAAVVTDDVMYDKDTPERVWNNDSIQFAVATDRKVGARNSEFGLGLSNGEVTLQQYTSQAINDGIIDTEYDPETQYAVKRYENERKTVYELKMKLSDIYDVVPDVKNLKKIVFAFCLNDHDGDSRGWMEYTSGGIAGTKSPSLYMDLLIYGN